MSSPALPHEVLLEQPVPTELASDVMGKWHYVSEMLDGFNLGPDGQTLRFRLKPGAEGKAGEIGARLVQVAAVMCRGYRGGAARILIDRSRPPQPGALDPHPQLIEQGLLFPLGQGRFGLGRLAARLVDLMDRDLLDAAAYLNAEPFRFPSIIGADILNRCRYLRSFPHALSLVQHLREDIDAIQRFARGVEWRGDRLDCDLSSLAPPAVLLAPTVCFHCYGAFADTKIGGRRTVTARGKCFRYESGGLRGLERLWDFSMREFIFLGERAHVQQERTTAVERFAALLDRWELSYQIQTASDPFFIDDFSVQSNFQKAFDLKYEIRAALPYRENASLAIGSFNLHHDFFGKSFGITNDQGEPLFTGCIGFGLERVLLAFLSQHGIDPCGWPAWVRERI